MTDQRFAMMGRSDLIEEIYQLEKSRENWCYYQCPNKNIRLESGSDKCFEKGSCILFPDD